MTGILLTMLAFGLAFAVWAALALGSIRVREGYGTERPVIAGEGSRDEPSSSNLNEESQTNGR